jgi:hypothetical protein
MYVSIAIHHPKGAKEEVSVLSTMRKFGEAQRKSKGCIIITACKDDPTGCIFAVGIWDNKENFFKAQVGTEKVLEEANFETLEDEARKIYLGEPVVWV